MSPRGKNGQPSNPRRGANLLSIITFGYIYHTLVKIYRKDLNEDDIPEILNKQSASKLGDKLDKLWQKEKASQNPCLWLALCRAFGLPFMFQGLCSFFDEIFLRLMRPIALIFLINYFAEEPEEATDRTDAYIFGGVIVATSLISVIVSQLTCQYSQILGMKIRVACTSIIYRKSLKLSKSALQDVTVGHIINLVTNDLNRIETFLQHGHYLWLCPLQIIIMVSLMYSMVGLSSTVGILFMVLLTPLQVFLGRMCAKLRLKTAVKSDERIRLMSEILTGIKVIKMYTWEEPFAKLVGSIRRLEARQIRFSNYIRAFIQSIGIAPKISIFITVATFILTGNSITAVYVFVVSCYYDTLKVPLTIHFGTAIGLLGELRVSIQRVQQLLLVKEVNQHTITYISPWKSEKTVKKTEKSLVELKDVSASWNPNSSELTLNAISLKVEENQLVGIIGPVGSGKSSILHLILNELDVKNGSIKVQGKISYASQEPWIFTGNIEENILFGQSMELGRYSEVLKVCALEKDLAMLPYGDQTTVGENGVILSGGQKSRINLARAIYKKADIYLLDDPLSAVDAHVSKHIFEQCIKKYLGKKSTILVTHQIQYLNQFNCVYLLESGRITASGTSEEVKASTSDFSNLLQLTENDDEPTNDIIDEPISNSGEQKSPDKVAETRKSGAISKEIFKSYLKTGGSVPANLTIVTIFLLSQLAITASDYFLAYWVNEEQREVDEFYESPLSSENCTFIYSGIIMFMLLSTLIWTYMFSKFSTNVSVGIHDNMISSVINTAMHFFHTNYSGRILNRFSKDMGIIDEIIPMVTMDCVKVMFTVLGSLIVISIVNYWMVMSTFGMLVIFYFIRTVYVRVGRSVRRVEGTVRSPVYGHMIETLHGLTTIRASNSQLMLENRFDSHQDLHSSTWYLFVSCCRTFSFYTDITCVIYITAITFFVILSDTKQFAGNVGLVITQGISFFNSIRWGIFQSCELENYMTSVERAMEYTKLKRENNRESNAPPETWPVIGSISFISLYLKYSPDEPYVLKDLNLHISSAQKIGIVGRTGAGKSSLITALFQLANTEGTILIDNLDITKMPLCYIRSKISIIPQDPVLFSGTVRNNLDPFGRCTDLELWNALEEVQLKTVISDLPLGLNHLITDGGSNFSVGQRQLICLGRALMRRNKILVLDEATANVDPDTDLMIQNTIRNKFSYCTVLTIAHRLHTIMDSDKILVIEAGEMLEYDHPHLLLQNPTGAFYLMLQETGSSTSTLLSKIAQDNYYQHTEISD